MQTACGWYNHCSLPPCKVFSSRKTIPNHYPISCRCSPSWGCPVDIRAMWFASNIWLRFSVSWVQRACSHTWHILLWQSLSTQRKSDLFFYKSSEPIYSFGIYSSRSLSNSKYHSDFVKRNIYKILVFLLMKSEYSNHFLFINKTVNYLFIISIIIKKKFLFWLFYFRI